MIYLDYPYINVGQSSWSTLTSNVYQFSVTLEYDGSALFIVPGDRAVALASGQWHTCSVLKDGSVYCWGKNDDGQLGTGDTASTLLPAKVSGLTGWIVVHVLMVFNSVCNLNATRIIPFMDYTQESCPFDIALWGEISVSS